MQQLVLVGAQGSFPVPSGESRIGSDAACQICIRGEGVLPVHAYLRLDGDKLLIRPAELDASSGKGDSARIAVNGEKLTGPATVVLGQELAIGSVQMRVISERRKMAGVFRKRWFKWSAYAAGTLAVLALFGYLFLAFVLFDESRISKLIGKNIAAALQREEPQIESVKVNLFEGRIEITNLRVNDRDKFALPSVPFIKIPEAHIKFDLWPMLKSWFGDYRNLKIDLVDPVISIERSKTDGSFNVDDIFQRMLGARSPQNPGNIENGLFTIRNGTIRLRDNYQNTSETALTTVLDKINIALSQPGPGKPLAIDECSMSLSTESSPTRAPGTLTLAGKIKLIDDLGVIDPNAIASDKLEIALQDFDLARIFEHLGYAFQPYNRNFKVVLGKPITGSVSLEAATLRALRFRGKARSASLLSIREEGKEPLGNVPMLCDFDVTLAADGRGYLPKDVQTRLVCAENLDDPKTEYLNFAINGKYNPGGTSRYTSTFNCSLQEVFNTDVGNRLALNGRLGGKLSGQSEILLDANRNLKIDINAESSADSYVMVPSARDANKPPSQRKATVKQALPLKLECRASALPDRLDVTVESFTLSSPSFMARSEKPAVIRRNDQNALASQAQFKLDVKGREFWTEFAPILALFGFTTPIEEKLDLTMVVYGDDDLISVEAKGTAARQWGGTPAQMNLSAKVDYNAKEFKGTAGVPVQLWKTSFETSAPGEKPLNIRVQAACSRDGDIETIKFEDQKPDGSEPGLSLKSDIQAFRDRFQPYIEAYLEYRGNAADSGARKLVELYRDSKVSGDIEQTGRVILTRSLNPNNEEPDKISFDLAFKGDFAADCPMSAVDFWLGPYRAENAAKSRFVWNEPALQVQLTGALVQRLSTNKEEPDTERLSVNRLAVKGKLGEFRASIDDLDLFTFSKLAGLPKRTWTDLANKLAVEGRIDAPAYAFLKMMRILRSDDPASGSIDLKIAFDRKKDSLELEKLQIKQSGHFLTDLDVNGALLKVREISQRLAPNIDDGGNIAERLSFWLEDSGPAAMLDHLGDELTLNALNIDTQSFVEWLEKNARKAGDARPLPVLFSSILARNWIPEGQWRAAGVKLARMTEPREPGTRQWKLAAAELRSDLRGFGPAEKTQPRPLAYSLQNPWRLQMGLSLSDDNNFGLSGDVFLDEAAIFGSFPALKFDYKKPAGEPCKLELSDSYYSHGRNVLAHIGKLKIAGKPVAVELKDFHAEIKSGTSGNYKLADFTIDGGPLPCRVALRQFNPETDKLDVKIQAPAVDLAYVADVLKLPVDKLEGKVGNATVAYAGSFLSLQAMIEPRAALAQRAGIPASDPRLNGINPDLDQLDLSGDLNGVKLALHNAKNASANFELGGQLAVSSRDVIWKNLSATVQARTAAAALDKIQLSMPKLQVNSSDAKLNLAQALATPGLPVVVNGAANFSTPLNVTQWLSARAELLPQAPNVPATSMESLRKIFASGSIKAPAVIWNGREAAGFSADSVTFRDLKANVQLVTMTLLGGQLALSEGEYDFSKLSVGENGALNGLAHSQRVRVAGADIARVAAPDLFGVAGKIDLQGPLAGIDFSSEDRARLDGRVEILLQDFGVALKPRTRAAASIPIAPWSRRFAPLGEKTLEALGAASAVDESALKIPGAKALDNIFLGVELYLGKVAGIEVDKFEFETATPIVVVKNGFAVFEPFILAGKNQCAGLTLSVRNLRINIVDETLADDVQIFPSVLPKSAAALWHLERWPAEVRDEFLRDMKDGKLALHAHGPLSAPVFKFPWQQMKAFGRRAVFGMERIGDWETLVLARANFQRSWGWEEPDIAAAAAVADRSGAGLPGTVSARQSGESVLDRASGLPLKLQALLRKVGPQIEPAAALQLMLFAEPDPPPANPQQKEKK